MQRSHLEDSATLVRDLLAQALNAPPHSRIWLVGVRVELERVLGDIAAARQRVNARDSRLLDELSGSAVHR